MPPLKFTVKVAALWLALVTMAVSVAVQRTSALQPAAAAAPAAANAQSLRGPQTNNSPPPPPPQEEEEASGTQLPVFVAMSVANTRAANSTQPQAPRPQVNTVAVAKLPVSVTVAVANTRANTTQPPQLPVFPNVDYLGRGYDVVKGNPGSNGQDPGWNLFQPVFALTYANQHTFGGQYSVPDQISVTATSSCSYQGSSFVMKVADEYQAALASTLSVDADSPVGKALQAVAFTASPDYQKLFPGGVASSTVYVGTEAVCPGYVAAWQRFGWTPTFASGFQAAVEGLGTSVPFLEFTQVFGTHYVSNVNLGASSFFLSTFDKTDLASFVSTYGQEGLTSAAELDWISHAGGDISGASPSQMQAYDAYSQVKQSSAAWGQPNPAPECNNSPMCNNASPWRATVQVPSGQPVPLHMELTPLVDLLTASHFPKDSNISTKAAGLSDFLATQYCADVKGCGAPPSASPSPSPTPSPLPPTLWGQSRHDSANTGMTDSQAGPRGPTTVVGFRVPGVTSPPVVAADASLFVGTLDQTSNAPMFARLDGSDGSFIWSVPTDGEITAAPAVGRRGAVYTAVPGGGIRAFNSSSGAALWQASDMSAVLTNMVLTPDESGLLLVLDGSDESSGESPSRLVLFDSASGNSVWTFNSRTRLGQPAVSDDGVVFVVEEAGPEVGGANLVALDAMDGTQLWAVPLGYSNVDTPITLSPSAIILRFIGSVIAYQLNGDDELWSSPVASVPQLSPGMALDASTGRLYVPTVDGVTVLDAGSGAQVDSLAGDFGAGGVALDVSGSVYFMGYRYAQGYSAAGLTQQWAYPINNAGATQALCPAVGGYQMLYVSVGDTLIAFRDA